MPATYQPLSTTTLGSAQSTISFNSFGGYTDLVLVCNLGIATADYIQLIFNGETSTTNYYGTWFQSDGSGGRYNSSIYWIGGACQFNTNKDENMAILHIMNYANTVTQKSVLARLNRGGSTLGMQVGSWNNTNAITSLDIKSANGYNFVSGSTFTLYGIAAA
jgi:hypothetical protein